MSNSEPLVHRIAADPPPSFRVECVSCNQIGLFATPEGLRACGWTAQWAHGEVIRGLLRVFGVCWECLVRGK